MSIIPRYILVLICMLSATSAIACRCKQPSLEDAYKNASLVVHASVKDVVTMPSGEGNTTILEIKNAWKAMSPARLAVISLTNCHYIWENQQEYIIFLTEEPNGMYSTDRCRANNKIDSKPDMLEWLNKNASAQKVNMEIR